MMLLRKMSALVFFLSFAVMPLPGKCATDQRPPGVAADGVTDDTAALQTALDQAGKNGGEVLLTPGRYLVKGSLTVPTGVSLRGSWDAPHHGVWDKGATLLLTGGREQEEGPAAITLQPSSALRGVTMIWPDEKADHIVPYPWAIHGSGMHNTVEDVTLVNAYQGIKIGQPSSELHLIRNVFGCVLRRGIFIDSTTDVGRIENVHFNTHYWPRSGYPPIQMHDDSATGRLVTEYTEKHLEAFLFGRADWEYVTNTFVWGAHIGYRFIKTPDGACNGQFLGIGADACNIGLLIDQIQGIGIQVTNAEFTAFTGPPNAGVVVSRSASGAAQFVNCNFWTTPGGSAQLHGDTQVTFNACHFAEGATPGVLVADRGHLIVNSCSFASTGNAIVLRPGVRSAIVTSNSQPGGLIVDNQIGAAARVALNETAYIYPVSVAEHYRINIGTSGDEEFLGKGWYSGETAEDGLSRISARFHTARWTNGAALLLLPVKPGVAYTLTIWLITRPGTPPESILVAGKSVPVAVGQNQRLVLAVPSSSTKGQRSIRVMLAGVPWSPARMGAGNGDARNLGVRVFAIEMQAAGGPVKSTAIN